jgi:hypothetical protein
MFSLYGIGKTLASGDKGHESDDGDDNLMSIQQNALYKEECASCHMAYPAQLLPPASWQAMMAGLDDHFGENAELDETSRQAIETYLTEASKSQGYRKLLRNLGNTISTRITELPYFVHEHNEIPARFIKANDKIGSLSQCTACHKQAEKGRFDEDDVYIPGVGRWDD